MIEGFKLLITSEELKQHCEARSAYHKKRAEEKEIQLPKLEESYRLIQNVQNPETIAAFNKMSSPSNSSYNLGDPVTDLKSDIKQHRNNAVLFKFYSEHLHSDDYNLDDSALRRLEMIK